MSALPGVPQPFPYQGSKRQLAAEIISRIPRPAGRFIEAFAGSAAISLAVAKRRLADDFLLSDSNAPLMALWAAIISDPEALADQYAGHWDNQYGRQREYYDEVRERFNRSHRPADFLYLLARCVKAAIRYNTNGEFNNSPDNRRLGMRPRTMRNNLIGCSMLLRGKTMLQCADYRETLAAAGADDVVYMDPPYQGVCGRRDNRYRHQVDCDDFVAALIDLNAREVPYLISYDGRTGNRSYGESLPEHLGLTKLEIEAGRSTQATLLGRAEVTFESLYLSPCLAARMDTEMPLLQEQAPLLFSNA